MYTAPSTHAIVASKPRTSWLNWLVTALAIHRERRRLPLLDEAALRDLGLTKAQIEDEANRAFWDVPARWMR